jgi:hypothetical protein
MEIKDWLDVITSIISLIGVFFFVYLYFRNPDIKAERDLVINQASCQEKHKRIDEIILEIRKSVEAINYTFAHFKENEFRHIEDEMKKMNDTQIKILTVLEYRDKMKIDN